MDIKLVSLPSWNGDKIEGTVSIMEVSGNQFFEFMALNEANGRHFKISYYNNCLVAKGKVDMYNVSKYDYYTLVWKYEEDYDEYGDNLMETLITLMVDCYMPAKRKVDIEELNDVIQDAIQEVLDKYV